MDDKCWELSGRLVGESYSRQAREAATGLTAKIRVLLEQGKLPAEGWEEREIEILLGQISSMDSNNFPANCGVGEREARLYCGLVQRRHYGLGHGIGRSGDLTEIQPKAAGSSLLNKLTNSMMLDIIKLSGVNTVKQCFLVPMATGMSLTLTMLALKKRRPEAKYVIWSRIDQKSCFKSILTAGLEPAIIELIRVGDELQTDLTAMRDAVTTLSPNNVLAIFSTTSCFAPRAPDDLVNIGKMCKEFNIPHIVNNAYGLSSSKCCHLISEAARLGRLDVFVQSTDKNLMVPVGGAVIAGFDKKLIGEISQSYPGRASNGPTLDVFMTLLSMGVRGYKSLIETRKEEFSRLVSELEALQSLYPVRVLRTKNNTISVALAITQESDSKHLTNIGSMLFTRGVSGTRVITGLDSKSIEGVIFQGWGSHTEQCSQGYLTAAAGLGVTGTDIDRFIKRLGKVLEKVFPSSSQQVLTTKINELMV